MEMTGEKKKNRFKEGLTFLIYALEVFGIIGLELLISMIEKKIYGIDMKNYNALQNILHWIITCTVWGTGAILIMKGCRKNTGVDLFDDIKNRKFIAKDMKLWQWISIAIGVVISLVSTWIDWNGSKVAAEFKSRGPLLFPFQYIYYLFEVCMVLLIIIFGQIAFEKWFKNNKIPFGGILVGITWGLAHWLSKGSLGIGLYSAVGGFVFGAAYVLTNRNVKLSYLLLCIMFIL